MSTEIGDHQANKDLMIKHLNTIKVNFFFPHILK